MKTLKLRIVGMHCESCEKLLKKALSKLEHIKDIDLRYNNEIATIHYNPEINVNDVINIIRQVGYDATVFSGDYKPEDISFKKYLKDLGSKNRMEREMVYVAFGTFLVLAILELFAYYGFFRTIPDFFVKYGYYLIFLLISIVICGASLWHIKAYGDSFSCMSGMMIGMTIGMISGFLTIIYNLKNYLIISKLIK